MDPLVISIKLKAKYKIFMEATLFLQFTEEWPQQKLHILKNKL